MEGFGGFSVSGIVSGVRKKRSNTSRRPRNESQPISEYCDISSTPPSDSVSKASSDENTGYGSSTWRKELNLNQCSSKTSSVNTFEVENVRKVIKNDDGGFGESSGVCINDSFRGSNEQRQSGSDSKRCSEGLLAPANWKGRDSRISSRISGSYSFGQQGMVSNELSNENKLKKVKLKVGGVTRTIHAKSSSDGASVGGSSSTKSSRSLDAPRPRQKLILQETSDEDHSPAPDRVSGLQGVPWKDFSRSGFCVQKAFSSRGNMPEESVSMKQIDHYEPVRKSKRVPKRRIFDDGDVDDEEIRYLEKLKTSKFTADCGAESEDDEEAGSKKLQKMSRVLKRNGDGLHNVDLVDYGASRLGKDGKKSRSGRASEDTDYVGEEDLASDGELETRRKKPKKDFVDSLGDSKKEMAVHYTSTGTSNWKRCLFQFWCKLN
ncbi:hypothetical protein L1049_019955 [Liquidambar formosana]|uniref:Uncharacterized protein n=1 Tax=Liquidambar formosana TaxID=63359 RepID=A0AAP0S7J3_LIQFO